MPTWSTISSSWSRPRPPSWKPPTWRRRRSRRSNPSSLATPACGGGMGRYDDGMTVIPIAAALIEDGAGHVLLVRKADTRFFMQAGGKIEPGEEPAAALVRELHEEIGLIVAE